MAPAQYLPAHKLSQTIIYAPFDLTWPKADPIYIASSGYVEVSNKIINQCQILINIKFSDILSEKIFTNYYKVKKNGVMYGVKNCCSLRRKVQTNNMKSIAIT